MQDVGKIRHFGSAMKIHLAANNNVIYYNKIVWKFSVNFLRMDITEYVVVLQSAHTEV